jgi:predicted GNAT family N-acyltransferase
VIARLATPSDLPAAFALRHEVFVVGQGVPAELELDELDAVCDHAVAVEDGEVVGTGRLLPTATIGRMAVREDLRGRGIGAAMLDVLERRARERGFSSVELHAQVHATAFYEKAGYVPYGAVYLEAGIEHRSMRKDLT